MNRASFKISVDKIGLKRQINSLNSKFPSLDIIKFNKGNLGNYFHFKNYQYKVNVVVPLGQDSLL